MRRNCRHRRRRAGCGPRGRGPRTCREEARPDTADPLWRGTEISVGLPPRDRGIDSQPQDRDARIVHARRHEAATRSARARSAVRRLSATTASAAAIWVVRGVRSGRWRTRGSVQFMAGFRDRTEARQLVLDEPAHVGSHLRRQHRPLSVSPRLDGSHGATAVESARSRSYCARRKAPGKACSSTR